VSEFYVEKVRRRVTVVLDGGTRIDGDIFLQSVARHRLGPEAPSEMLNDRDPFFPLAQGRESTLIAKRSVTQVEFASQPTDTQLDGTPGVTIAIRFADGTELVGDLYPETRAGRRRLLDFLNSDGEQFLAVHVASTVVLVNRRLIASVRQVS
jgi:hypothetical protein